MEVIRKGSVEPLLVGLNDRLRNVSDLDVVPGKLYDVRRKVDDAAVQTNEVWVVDEDYPMYAICMIDTTLGGYTTDSQNNEFKLYVKWEGSGEQVVKGPLYFRVESD